MTPERELNETQAARYLGIPRTTFQRHRAAGLIKPTRTWPFGGRRYAIHDLENFRDRYATKQGYRRRA